MHREPTPPGVRAASRILLVDDEEVVRRVTATALRRFGYAVVDAATGAEGAMLAEEHAGRLELLLTDMLLSDLSGFDVAAAFRAHNPGRPVIFTSGYGDVETQRRIDREGARFLIKPYDVGALAEAVRRALAGGPDGGAATHEGRG
jgi:two-component system cell cycle sensor histidine kinase/response regulator CckA